MRPMSTASFFAVRTLVVFLASPLVVGCVQPGNAQTGKGSNLPSGAQTERDQLEALRAEAEKQPTSGEAVLAYGEAAAKPSRSLVQHMERAELTAHIRRAGQLLGNVADSLPDAEASRALLLQATTVVLLTGNYDSPELDDLYSRAFSKHASLESGWPYTELLAKRGTRSKEATAACGQTFTFAEQRKIGNEQLVQILRLCRAVLPKDQTVAVAYPAITAATWKAADDYTARRAEDRRDQGRAAQAEQDARSSSSPLGPVAPSSTGREPATQSVSVRVHSECSKTAKVFYGNKPKYGSGTESTVGGNSTQNHSFKPGDMLWLLDASGNGTSSATVSTSTREIAIGKDCTSLSVQ